MPQEIAASSFGVNIEAAGKQYSWKSSSAITLESGKAYTLEFTLGKNKITASPISVSGWGAGGALTGGEVERLEAERIAIIMNEALSTGNTDIVLTLSENAGADVFNSIKTALTEKNLADGSISLTLKGVKNVPDAAFESVPSLKSVSMPNVVNIGKSAFASCGNIEYMEFKKAGYLAAECFAGCCSLKILKLGVLWSLVYSGENDAEGNILRNVSTNNIDLFLGEEQGKMYNGGTGNVWTGSNDSYRTSSDFDNRIFTGMTFKSITLWY